MTESQFLEVATDDSAAKSTATRFAPVIAAAKEPPFTPYHSKYLAYELTRRVGADQADKLAQSLRACESFDLSE